MRSPALDRTARRIVWLRLAGLGLVLVLAGRAAHLTVAHTRARSLYDQQIRSEQRLAPARGTIFDRDGRELAITTEAASIYALPRLLEDRAAAAAGLSEALELDLARVTRRLEAHDGFTYIARWVEPEAAERVRALALAGVGVDREPRRAYPAGALAAPLIGFANIDGQGVRGIEQAENAWLIGRQRRVNVERDARGRTLALRSTDPRTAQGGDVALTLDAAMQGAAEAALAEAVTRHEARGGLVLTLDPATGDLLALAEAPGFDPNRFRELDYAATRARAFSDVVEAGSTMKVFLVASALDAGLITPTDEFGTEEGWLRVRGKTIRDRRPFGVLTPSDVLRVSSNVGAVQIAQRVGREAQYQGLLRFGFGGLTHSGFPMESPGLIRDWLDWKPVDQATISFGQGLSVTAIQLGAALAAIANEGERMQPRLIRARREVGGPWQETAIRSRGRAVSARAARETLAMMRQVVSSKGTGRLAGLADVAVAGKTGTAQKLDVELGRYSQDRYIAWFMGVVPANDPQLAIVVAVDEPSGELHSGGGVAAPLFAQVAAAQLGARGVVTAPAPFAPTPAKQMPVTRLVHEEPAFETPPSAAVAAPPARPAALVAAGPPPPSRHSARPLEDDWIDVAPPLEDGIDVAPPLEAGGLRTAHPRRDDTPVEAAFVPDFSGLTIARAMATAQRELLEIRTKGAIEGHVVSQIPVPGTVLEGADRTVRLRFATHHEEG